MTRQNRTSFSKSRAALIGAGALVVGLATPLAAQADRYHDDDDWRGVIGTALILAHANDHGHGHYQRQADYYRAHAYRGHPGHRYQSKKHWRKHQKHHARRHAAQQRYHHDAWRQGDGHRDGGRGQDRHHDDRKQGGHRRG